MKDKKLKTALAIVSVLAFLLLAAGVLFTLRYFNVVGPQITKAELFKEAGEINVPIVEINTRGSISKTDEYTSCSFAISNCENEAFNFSVSGAENATDEGGVGIRVRGKTTSRALKKPYRIKFNEKTSVLGMKANKSWVLLADYYDQSYIRNYTALTLASYFNNLDFTPTPNHVALFVNGKFMGLYLLCEQIDEESGRLDIEQKNENMSPTDKDYPLHLVIEKSLENGKTPETDFFINEWAYVEIKYPDYEDRMEISQGNGDPVYEYAKEYMAAVFETARTGGTVNVSFSDVPVSFEDLVDVESMIDYYLLNEILLNCDSCIKSFHLHKAKGGKLEFGPVWDFDWSLDCEHWDLPYTESGIEFANTIEIASRSKLFKLILSNESYYNLIAERYSQIKESLIIVADSLRYYKEYINGVALVDAHKWHGRDGQMEYSYQFDYVRLFLYDRYDFLSYAFSLSHKEFLELVNK